MNAPARSLSFPRTVLLRCLGLALLALAAAPAEAQIENWGASGEVSMLYRTQPGGTVYGRNAATISETVSTDIISTIEVGGTGGPSDDDPGDLDLANAGDEETPRNIGDVDVNVGTFSLNSSIVTGRIDVARPTAVLSMQLSETGPGTNVNVRDGGTLTAQASYVGASVTEGGIARVSGITGSLSSSIGADIEIDGSTLLAASFQGKQVLTNCTATGPTGRFLQGEFGVEFTSVDVVGDLAVGGNTTGAVPTDTHLDLADSSFESGTGTVRAGTGIATLLTMRNSFWQSFGLFTVIHPTTQLELQSGSSIDARADFRISSAFATIGSTTTTSRIDVAGDFDLDGSLPGALTIEDGGYVDVDGTFTIGEFATLNLNGGTLRVGAFVNDAGGTFNENGGTLIVPEAGGLAAPIAAAFALAGIRRR